MGQNQQPLRPLRQVDLNVFRTNVETVLLMLGNNVTMVQTTVRTDTAESFVPLIQATIAVTAT